MLPLLDILRRSFQTLDGHLYHQKSHLQSIFCFADTDMKATGKVKFSCVRHEDDIARVPRSRHYPRICLYVVLGEVSTIKMS